jgi:hypothetical protein
VVTFDIILGLPWLRRWSPVVDWRGEKMLMNGGGQDHVMNTSLDPTAGRQSDVKNTFVSAVLVTKEIRKGSDWFMSMPRKQMYRLDCLPRMTRRS